MYILEKEEYYRSIQYYRNINVILASSNCSRIRYDVCPYSYMGTNIYLLKFNGYV